MAASGREMVDMVERLEGELKAQQRGHDSALKSLRDELAEMQQLAKKVADASDETKMVAGTANTDVFARRVEWTLTDFKNIESRTAKGQSHWSPKFKIAGMEGLQLEFSPKGRENTQHDGFCSLFLWCPSGTKVKYQLWVGNFVRAPDDDEYHGRTGHGHSNLCPLEPQVDRVNDTVKLGVDFLEVMQKYNVDFQNFSLTTTPLEQMVSAHADCIQNRGVNKVTWKISKISERMARHPRCSSILSESFTAGGVRDVQMELFPNGNVLTEKDGWCAFYIRCPQGVSKIITLIVGGIKRGPVKTTFDGQTGKGLPDFCHIHEVINKEDNSIEVGIEFQNEAAKTLSLVSP